MYKYCLVLICVATVLAFPQHKDNLDDIIAGIFGPENTKKTSTTPKTGVIPEDLIDSIFGSNAIKKPSPTIGNLDFVPDKVISDVNKKTPSINGVIETKTEKECVVSNRSGVCVRYHLCGTPVTIPDLIDSAAIEEHDCKSYLDVCCNIDSVMTEPPKA